MALRGRKRVGRVECFELGSSCRGRSCFSDSHTSGSLRVKDAPATGLRFALLPPQLSSPLLSPSCSSLPLSLPSSSVSLSPSWLYHVTGAFVLARQCKLTPGGLRGLRTRGPHLLATICWTGRLRSFLGSESDIWWSAASAASS